MVSAKCAIGVYVIQGLCHSLISIKILWIYFMFLRLPKLVHFRRKLLIHLSILRREDFQWPIYSGNYLETFSDSSGLHIF